MTIIDNRKERYKEFSSLVIGATFVTSQGQQLFMKIKKLIDDDNNVFINAISLTTGDGIYINDWAQVIQVKSTLTFTESD